MSRRASTTRILEIAIEVLREGHPMTVRQVYYQLVSRQVIENKRSAYQAVSNLLVRARKSGEVPWAWIEDRLREPRCPSMWTGLPSFMGAVRRSYRRDVWQDQADYVECWLEKDALSGIFADVLEPYGVTLNVGRGFDGWSSIHQAAERYRDRLARHHVVSVLYFGDFDPSGEDMFRSLGQRLADRECWPELVKVAVTYDDIARYNLPPDFTKTTDSRRNKFVAKYGDLSVELDALPTSVLRGRIEDEVRDRMDLGALDATYRTQEDEFRDLDRLLATMGADGGKGDES